MHLAVGLYHKVKICHGLNCRSSGTLGRSGQIRTLSRTPWLGLRPLLVGSEWLGAARFIRLHSRSVSNRVRYYVVPTPIHFQVTYSMCWLTGSYRLWYDFVSAPIQFTNSKCLLTASRGFWYNVGSTFDLIACSIGLLTGSISLLLPIHCGKLDNHMLATIFLWFLGV